MKKGIAASKGYALGTAFVIDSGEIQFDQPDAVDAGAERERLRVAVERARGELGLLREKAGREINEAAAAILDVQIQLLDDPEFTGKADASIAKNRIGAARAVRDVVDEYMEIFAGMEDEYLRERAADVKDIGMRLLRHVTGNAKDGWEDLPERAIVVAHDLTPSDTALMDKDKVIAFITDRGGPTSHSAIMARALEIPAVVGLGDITVAVASGDRLIVDGVAGEVMLNPDEATTLQYRDRKNQFEAERAALQRFIHMPAVTKRGKKVLVAANVGGLDDVDKAVANGADGIGLFRTEFLYMGRETMPSEDEQFQAYRRAAEQMAGKPVVIRTLDIGGDKTLPYLPLPDEMNPFLGFRAIRLCLARVNLFKTQLKAILRAAVYGDIQMMFPMIGSLEELLHAKAVLKACMAELKEERKPFNDRLAVGVMIEIPAAALIAATLAREADFFSIGTNDLIQYTLAVDRMNANVSYLYNPMHPAVLQLIKTTIEAAHREGKWCGVCGEMAGDTQAIPSLLEYGLDEFSMNAGSILEVKRMIINA